MNKIEILVIGRHPQIMETVVRLVKQNEKWNADAALTDEEAVELFHQRNYDIILLCSGIEDTSEKKLRSLFTFQNPDIIIIQHYGGGSGLLSNEILQALDKRDKENKPVLHVKDGI